MNTHNPETTANPPTSQHDVWAQPGQAARAQMLLEKMQDNPDFLHAADQWASMLIDGQTPVYTERGPIQYTDSGTLIPDHFTYENPFPERKGFIEYSQDELAWPNPMVHVALDAAVKNRDGSAFVAASDPQRFDAYDDDRNDPYAVGYFVLGDQEEHASVHPQETAGRALAVFTGRTFKAAELAPRYSEAGAQARQEAKAAATEAHAQAFKAAESARELGGSAFKLLGHMGAVVLGRLLANQHRIAADSTDIPPEVHSVLRHVWIPSEKPGVKTTPRSLQALHDAAAAGQVRFGDILNAGATLFPNDSPHALLRRFME